MSLEIRRETNKSVALRTSSSGFLTCFQDPKRASIRSIVQLHKEYFCDNYNVFAAPSYFLVDLLVHSCCILLVLCRYYKASTMRHLVLSLCVAGGFAARGKYGNYQEYVLTVAFRVTPSRNMSPLVFSFLIEPYYDGPHSSMEFP